MIAEAALSEWAGVAPWNSNEQVEQDLVICRGLIDIFSDDFLASHLAFRGGTALHKLYIAPQPKYSEDIDLVQIKAEPIKQTIDRLEAVLPWLGKPAVKQKANNNTLIFRFNSEIPPIVPLRLKIETNCREHFNVLGLTKKNFSVNSRWFFGKAEITTYSLDELLGTKLRALYQRRKGRDLFDLYKALTTAEVNVDRLLKCYSEYMAFVVDRPPTQKEFRRNMDAKMRDDEFLGDTRAILRSSEHYDPYEAFELVTDQLLARL